LVSGIAIGALAPSTCAAFDFAAIIARSASVGDP
jgi:hypothetical protein